MKQLFTILFALFTSLTFQAQIVVIDPGHGYGATTSDNPDGRTATEIETSLEVGLRTRTLIQNSCSALDSTNDPNHQSKQLDFGNTTRHYGQQLECRPLVKHPL